MKLLTEIKKISTLFAFVVLATAAAGKIIPVEITPERFAEWNKTTFVALEKLADGSYAVKVEISQSDKSKRKAYNVVEIPIDVSKYRGKSLMVKLDAELVDVKKSGDVKDLNFGSKIFFKYTKDAQPVYFGIRTANGTLKTKFAILLNTLPDDVLSGTLSLGLANATGTIYYKNIKLAVGNDAVYWIPKLPNDFKCEYTDRLAKCPPMRGAMVRTVFNEKDMRDFRAWNGNLIRVSFGGSPADNRWTFGDKEEAIINSPEYFELYDAWLDKKLCEVQKFLDEGAKIGVKVVVGLHSTPGFRYCNKDMRIFFEKKYADKFVAVWKKIARRFKGHPAVWCFDLCNEPIQSIPSARDYLKLQYQTARAIRQIDPDVPISVEAVNWDNPMAFKYLKPLQLKDIIYQAHMYFPGNLTHQGVSTRKLDNTPVFYPNPKSNTLNKAALVDALQPVIDFQKKWGARIYIGEFSCIRWAPGRELYIKDLIDIFEEHGWDWTYHAFREWDGWSVEHGSDINSDKVSPTDTPAKKILLEAFKKNK